MSARGQKIKLDTTELSSVTRETAPSPSGNRAWRQIKSFIFWSHERGTIQYDVMVTLILLFVFLSPYWIKFKDNPVERNPYPSGVLVYPDGKGEFIYQVEARAVQAENDASVRASLLKIIEPISGSVSISSYEKVMDKKGNVLAYKVWVKRE